MKRIALFSLTTLILVACQDQPIPTAPPIEQQRAALPPQAAAEAQIAELINALFPQPEKSTANRLFAQVKRDMARGNTPEAQQGMFDLLDLALATFQDGRLRDPRGPETTEQALSRLTDLLFQFVDLGSAEIDPAIFEAEDFAVQVVPPEGGTVLTENEFGDNFAGVDIPAAALDETILVTIRKIDQDPCLPTGLIQSEGCWEFVRFPAGQFDAGVDVAVCVDVESLDPALRPLVRLHKFAPGQGVEVVELSLEDIGVNCSSFEAFNSSGSSRLQDFATALTDRVAALLGPRPLFASAVIPRPKRLGGTTTSFTDFGGAIPVDVAIGAGNNQTAEVGTAVPIPPAVEVRDTTGALLAGVEITFIVESGGGSVTGAVATTNASGIATVGSWTLGTAAGLNTLIATAAAQGDSVTFTATAVITVGANYQLELAPGLIARGSFKGTPVLFAGGLSYGNSATSVLFYNTRNGRSDFTGGDIVVLSPGPIADEQTVTVMTEAPNDDPESKTPLGLTIVRETFAYDNPADDDYVIVRYTISNPGATAVSGLHIGQIIDADIAVFDDDNVEFVSADQVARVTSGTDPALGFILLGDAVTSYRAWRNPSTPGPTPEDPSTNAGWFSFLSGGIVDPDISFGPSDIRHVLSHGPVSIEPGGSRVVTFALVGGDDATDLATNVAAARAKFASVFLTPVIDGVMDPGEWDEADSSNAFSANVPEGGTTSAKLFILNDGNNLYLAVRFARTVVDPGNSLAFEFDNDNDGVRENGDDVLLVNPASGFFDEFRTNISPCPTGSGQAACGFFDTDDGGTNDGAGAFGNDGTFSVYEMSHPLNSGDAGHDFSLSAGDTVGMFLFLRMIGPGAVFPTGFGDTTFPAVGFLSVPITP